MTTTTVQPSPTSAFGAGLSIKMMLALAGLELVPTIALLWLVGRDAEALVAKVYSNTNYTMPAWVREHISTVASAMTFTAGMTSLMALVGAGFVYKSWSAISQENELGKRLRQKVVLLTSALSVASGLVASWGLYQAYAAVKDFTQALTDVGTVTAGGALSSGLGMLAIGALAGYALAKLQSWLN